MLQTLIAFLVALTVLIFVHEMGHYLAARWFNVKVLRFSIGFGKPLLTWRVGPDQTEWSVAAIPLGGYVKMLDERELDAASIAPADLPRAFSQQSLAKRSVIVLGGPVANFLLAILLYGVLGLIGVQEPAPIIAQPVATTPAAVAGLLEGDRVRSVDGNVVRSWNDIRMNLLEPVIERRLVPLDIDRKGEPVALQLDTSTLPEGEAERDFMKSIGLDIASGKVLIGHLLDGGAAKASGLQAGDEVLQLAGRPIQRARDMINIIRDNPEQALKILVLRGTDELQIELTPKGIASDRPEENGLMVGRIGANLQDKVATELVRHGPLDSLIVGATQTWNMTFFSLRMFGKMLMGDLSLRNLSGPVTIADIAGRTAKVGWFAYVNFLALISISLGVLNLLPIPVLDGGHLVYYGLEAIKGKPLSERFMQVTQYAGVGVIMLMMMVALFNDITRLIG